MLKIVLKEGQNIWFTSDTHYGQANIVRGISSWPKESTRDYKDIPHMNRALVSNINSYVKMHDILIHLGDWSFGGASNIWKFRRSINCKNVYIVTGNHDHHIINNKEIPGEIIGEHSEFYAQELFTGVYSYLLLEIHEITGKHTAPIKTKFVCSHYPFASWEEMGRGRIHLHGHIHTSPKNKVGPGRMMDIGVDGHPEFKPYSLREIKAIMEGRPIKGLLTHNEDHHG